MEVMVETCCGIDVHQKSVVCCILDGPLDTNTPKKQHRTFGTTTKKLREAVLPTLDQNQFGLVSLHKGSDRKVFTICVQDCLINSEYGWLAQGESLLYPLAFTLSDDSQSYEAISLTTDYFTALLGDSFLRYGSYFINGLGIFTVSITAKGTYLTYQRGTKRKNPEKYMYYIPLIGERSVSVLKLSQLFNELATLKPESDRL